MPKPLVPVDPWPRRRTMIFGEDQWVRLEAMARVTAILGQTDLPAERIERAPHRRAIINVEGNFFPNVDNASTTTT